MMTMNKKVIFAERFSEALDVAGVPAGRGRLRAVATMFGVSRESARKWLAGEALPETTRITEIANRLDVNGEWLLTGRGAIHGGEAQPPENTSETDDHLEWCYKTLDGMLSPAYLADKGSLEKRASMLRLMYDSLLLASGAGEVEKAKARIKKQLYSAFY